MNIGQLKKWITGLLALIFLLVFLVPSDRFVNIKAIGGFLIFGLFGYLILKLIKLKLESRSLLEIFGYSQIVGMSVSFLVLFLLGSLGIGVESFLICISGVIISLSAVFLISKDRNLIKKIKESLFSWDTIVSLGVLNLLLVVNFLPANGLFTAPLHDPAHNSIETAHLTNGNFLYSELTKFAAHYPPGAAYILGIFSTLTGIDGAKSSLIFTIFMSLMAPFALKLFTEKYFKNKKFSYVVFVVSAILFPYVFGLYSLAGKNSQIFAYSFLFISLALFYESIKGKLSLRILLGLLVAASGLVHYTNFFIFGTFAAVILLIGVLNKDIRPKEIFKESLLLILPALVAGTFAFIQYKNISILPGEDNLSSFQINPLGELSTLNFFKYLTEPPANIFQRLNSVFPFVLSFIYLASLVFTVYEYKRSKKAEKLNLFILLMPFGFLPLYLFGPFKVSYFSNYHVFFFVTMILAVSLYYFFDSVVPKGWGKVSRIAKLLVVVLLSSYGVFATYWLYKSNMSVRDDTAIDTSDIKAFEWIEENVPADSYFLPSAIYGFEKNQNFETDGLLYLKAFTSKEEVFGFVQGNNFGSGEEYRDEYFALAENLEDENSITTLLNSRIKYVYVDSASPLGIEYIDPERFTSYPNTYKEIYDLDGIRIYEIITK